MDVFANAAVEQAGLLGNQADLLVQRMLGHLAHVLAVHQHLALLHVVETQEQAQQGRLAGARSTHQADFLAGGDDDIQVFENRTVTAIAEADIAKLDIAALDHQRLGAGLVDDFMGADQGAHTVGDIAGGFEEFEKASRQVFHIADDQQRKAGGHDKRSNVDTVAAPQVERQQ
eukprot:gene18347-biopygen9866